MNLLWENEFVNEDMFRNELQNLGESWGGQFEGQIDFEHEVWYG